MGLRVDDEGPVQSVKELMICSSQLALSINSAVGR